MSFPLRSLRVSSSAQRWQQAVHLLLVAIEAATLLSDNIPVSLQVLALATGAVFIGACGSLIDSDDIQAGDVERLEATDAYMFPIFGSATLLVAYAAVKYAPQWLLDVVVRGAFVAIGAMAIQAYICALIELFVPDAVCRLAAIPLGSFTVGRWPFPLFPSLAMPTISWSFASKTERRKADPATVVTIGSALGLVAGVSLAALWFSTEHYLLNNLIGLSVCMQAIAFINPGSFFTAAVFLVLLFFYDVFWVFGTEVMVTVAKGINAPIKLLFPRPAVAAKPSMLGLGDIVLPGIYIALVLRYDVMRAAARAAQRVSETDNTTSVSFGRQPLFATALLGYVSSLGLCLWIMYFFDHPQPALLYLVPGVLLPVMTVAFLRGEFGTLWQYDEEPEKGGEEKDRKEKKRA